MALILKLIDTTQCAIDVRGVIPTRLTTLSIDQIGEIEVIRGNRAVRLGNVFEISGTPSSNRIIWEPSHMCSMRIHYVGYRMNGGEMIVKGNAGCYVGCQMSSGDITVEGSADFGTGAEMTGGKIQIQGDSGDLVGGALPGSHYGMNGGTILVDGSVGNGCGFRMRRGFIAVTKNAGQSVGHQMLAGTIVFGSCETDSFGPGVGMKRGTLVCLSPMNPAGRFKFNCLSEPTVLNLLQQQAKQAGCELDEHLVGSSKFQNFSGDYTLEGKGELFVLAPEVLAPEQ